MQKRRNLADQMKRKLNEPVQVIWDNLDFSWTQREMEEVERLWERGVTIEDICDIVRPYTPIAQAGYEVTMLIMYLSEQDRLEPRERGIL